ncbi:MAG: hypothetical protein WB384_08830 [Candidatus Sulfotelmatobacter sp.]
MMPVMSPVVGEGGCNCKHREQSGNRQYSDSFHDCSGKFLLKNPGREFDFLTLTISIERFAGIVDLSAIAHCSNSGLPRKENQPHDPPRSFPGPDQNEKTKVCKSDQTAGLETDIKGTLGVFPQPSRPVNQLWRPICP